MKLHSAVPYFLSCKKLLPRTFLFHRYLKPPAVYNMLFIYFQRLWSLQVLTWTHIAQGFSDSSLLEKAIGLYNTRNEKISFRATLPGYDQSPAGAWPASAGQVARPPLGLLTGPKLLQRTQGTCPGPRVPHCFIPTGSRTPHTHLFLAPTRVRTSSISLA